MRGHRPRVLLHALLLVPPVAGCLALVLFGTRSSGAAEHRPFDARLTYLADCATCHAADARGSDRGPDLTHSDGALIDYELSSGRMPLREPDAAPHRSRPRYAAAEIRALTDYLLSITHAPRDAVHVDLRHANVANGGELFRLNCAACHTATGAGGALLHRAAPPLAPASSVQVAEAVREGPGNMPVFGTAALDSRQLDDVVAYVRYLRHPDDRGGLALGHIGPIVEGLVGFGLGTGGLLVVTRAIGTRS